MDAELLTQSRTRQKVPSETLVYSTVRLETKYPNGDSGTGTGFFFAFAKQGEKFVPAIVTNKHVVDGASQGTFCIHRQKQDGSPDNTVSEKFAFDNFAPRWIAHPNPRIDLCCMPIAPILESSVKNGRPVAFIALDTTLIPSASELADLTPLEEVLMIGYPNGIWDSANNMPILRRGITATHPNICYEGRREFMIDAACFPGSSGSPVFLYNSGGFYDPFGNFAIGVRVKLLGILYAGPQHTVHGELQVTMIPTRNVVHPISRIPNNLGMVMRAEHLLDFDDLFSKLLAKEAATLPQSSQPDTTSKADSRLPSPPA
jgi:hypothetical protein